MVKFQQAQSINKKEFSSYGIVLKSNKPTIQNHYDVTVTFKQAYFTFLTTDGFKTHQWTTHRGVSVSRSGSNLQ